MRSTMMPPIDNAEAEAGEPGAADQAGFETGKIEGLDPVIEDGPADTEADTGGENGHEAGPEESSGIGGNAVLFDVHIG
jgi:hypothetical protein